MDSVASIPDDQLVRRVISKYANRPPHSRRQSSALLWSVVSDQFCLGSTYAIQLCARFGFDPYMQVRP